MLKMCYISGSLVKKIQKCMLHEIVLSTGRKKSNYSFIGWCFFFVFFFLFCGVGLSEGVNWKPKLDCSKGGQISRHTHSLKKKNKKNLW